jgi:DNA-binding response OmpR family regulator
VVRTVSPPTIQLSTTAHIVRSGERQVNLTPIEFRLLEVLHARQPVEVPVEDLVLQVWGFKDDRGTSQMIRAHVRNLRHKLAQIGLPNAVRSRRGRGYALAL